MGCAYAQRQALKLSDALGDLSLRGILPENPVYSILERELGGLRTKFGLKVARGVIQLLRLVGLSPGEFRLWWDMEGGWMVEAREKPGAPPVYRYVDAETAVRIIKGDIDHELEERLMAPAEPVAY